MTYSGESCSSCLTDDTCAKSSVVVVCNRLLSARLFLTFFCVADTRMQKRPMMRSVLAVRAVSGTGAAPAMVAMLPPMTTATAVAAAAHDNEVPTHQANTNGMTLPNVGSGCPSRPMSRVFRVQRMPRGLAWRQWCQRAVTVGAQRRRRCRTARWLALSTATWSSTQRAPRPRRLW